jgi:hypothetical protein
LAVIFVGRRRPTSPVAQRPWRFCSDEKVEDFRKDGPVAVALFEKGEAARVRETFVLRQREAGDLVERLPLIG